MPDILLTPTNPISSSFHVKGLTCDGEKFVAMEFPLGIVTGEAAMDRLRYQAWFDKLTIETDWTCAGKALAS